MKLKVPNAIWLALAIVVVGLGARQAYTLIEYPPTKSGLICVGDPKPFDCEFPPAAVITATIGPRPSNTPTAQAATSTPAPTLPPVTATNTVTPAPPLLINSDFEQTFTAGWTAFTRYRDTPIWNDERGDPRSRHGGAQSLRIWNEYRCHLAGVYQTVAVTRFETYKFSVWGRTWASDSSSFDTPSDLNVLDGVSVGIDPSGGINPGSTGVVWAEADNTEVWRQVSVQATALSSRITVFIQTRLGVPDPSSPACMWPKPFLMGFVDDARLEIVP